MHQLKTTSIKSTLTLQKLHQNRSILLGATMAHIFIPLFLVGCEKRLLIVGYKIMTDCMLIAYRTNENRLNLNRLNVSCLESCNNKQEVGPIFPVLVSSKSSLRTVRVRYYKYLSKCSFKLKQALSRYDKDTSFVTLLT